MAEQAEYIYSMGASGQPFSRISYSGAAFYGDATLGRVAAARVWQQKTVGNELLLAKLGVAVFVIDIATDTLYYQRILPDGNRVERKIAGFAAILQDLREGQDADIRKAAEAISHAMQQETQDEVRFRGSLFDERLQQLEIVFRSTIGAGGKVESVAGYVMSSDAIDHLHWHENKAASREAPPCDEEELRQLVNSGLNKLRPGEKGVLFLIDMRPPAGEESETDCPLIPPLTKAIRGDFRRDDIVGKLSPGRLALFMCGKASMDIIERRAQRLLELCSTLPAAKETPWRYSIGVAHSVSLAVDFDKLVAKAEEALTLAKKQGHNEYRLYAAREL
ncbi:MAG: diguanylate cyclase [Selenomonadaceae bacterium]|nr:diguanylate cyclase [Selenomonadaceae bacterium]